MQEMPDVTQAPRRDARDARDAARCGVGVKFASIADCMSSEGGYMTVYYDFWFYRFRENGGRFGAGRGGLGRD